MKFRRQLLGVVSAAMLVCSLLPGAAQAQFFQQGPELVGTLGEPAAHGGVVSLSDDGNTAIVGGRASDDFSGAAWVFTRSDGVWSQQAKLIVTGSIGDAFQGWSVSLSGDGNTAIAGGPGDNNQASGRAGSVGAAWVFTRSGRVWSQQAKLIGTDVIGPFNATQGYSVSLSDDGDTAIVGGPSDGGGVGAAWIFTRSGGIWLQQAKLIGTGGGGAQGVSVSLSGDGNTAMVGAPADGPFGAAWVFTRSGAVWSQQGPKLATAEVTNASQGGSVSLSGDGNIAIVGGALDGPLVYLRSGGVWSEQTKLIGTGAVEPALQGFSVSLSRDGNIAIAGGPGDNASVGAAWVFTRSGGVWSQEQAKLVGTSAIGAAEQGASVSLSGNGNTAIVGGFGAAWVYAPFAGTPETASCYGKSASTLVREFGGLNAAAAGVGFPSVSALQDAILSFCEE